MKKEIDKAWLEDEIRHAVLVPGGLAKRLRENLKFLLIVTSPITVSICMISAGYFFKIPQLIDWGVNGFKAGALCLPVAFNLLPMLDLQEPEKEG